MEKINKLLVKYKKKVDRFFAINRFFLFLCIITISYSLANYLSNNSFIIFNLPWDFGLYFFIIFSIILIVNYWIGVKLNSRLIIEIIDEAQFYSLVIYNKALVKLDKKLIPIPREGPDYFINALFSTRLGTINLPASKGERFVLIIDNKKYYLVPVLFESDVLI